MPGENQLPRIIGAMHEQSGVASEIAQAIRESGHRKEVIEGTVAYVHSLNSIDRGYSGYAHVRNLKPIPPVNIPIVDRGVLEVSNSPKEALDDRRGNNGYAIYVAEGIVRNAGESWLLKFGQVAAVTTVVDGQASQLDTSILTTTHFVADCFECGDSKAREATDVPVRIFYENEGSTPTVGKAIGYLRDQHGLAHMVTDPGGSSSSGQWFKATTNWAIDGGGFHWVTANIVDNRAGDNPGEEVTLFLPCSPEQDANVYIDDVLPGKEMSDGLFESTGGYEGRKVGFIDTWAGTIENIPRGWALCNGANGTQNLRGRFVVGYDPEDADYGQSDIGGLHPKQPYRHSSVADPGNGAWLPEEWLIVDHTPTATSSSTTGVSNPEFTGSTSGTNLSVADTTPTALAATGSVTTNNASINISVDDHGSHTHGIDTVNVDDSAYAAGTEYYWIDDTWTGATGTENGTLTHVIQQENHLHTADHTLLFGNAGQGFGDASHNHGSGAVSPDPHDHAMTHNHDPVTDPGHTHDTPTLDHTGTLNHREEDFRPPFYALAYIQRIAA